MVGCNTNACLICDGLSRTCTPEGVHSAFSHQPTETSSLVLAVKCLSILFCCSSSRLQTQARHSLLQACPILYCNVYCNLLSPHTRSLQQSFTLIRSQDCTLTVGLGANFRYFLYFLQIIQHQWMVAERVFLFCICQFIYFSIPLNLWRTCVIEKGVCVWGDVDQCSCEESGFHEYRQLVSLVSTGSEIAPHFTVQLRLLSRKSLATARSDKCNAAFSLKHLMFIKHNLCEHILCYSIVSNYFMYSFVLSEAFFTSTK